MNMVTFGHLELNLRVGSLKLLFLFVYLFVAFISRLSPNELTTTLPCLFSALPDSYNGFMK